MEENFIPVIQAVLVPSKDQPISEVATSGYVDVEILTGVVSGCTKLNIRKEPNKTSEVVATVPAGTEVVIDPDKMVDNWYYVCTSAGVEGYCMLEYILVNP